MKKPHLGDEIFFYCPSCTVAWDELPTAVDDIQSFNDLAPKGAVTAKEPDLENIGIQSFTVVIREPPDCVSIRDHYKRKDVDMLNNLTKLRDGMLNMLLGYPHNCERLILERYGFDVRDLD